MTDILRALQVLFIVAWTVPLVLFARQAWSKATCECDRLAAATWYAALSVIAFPLRWLLQGGPVEMIPPNQLILWSALYVLGVFASFYLTLAVHRVCRRA